MAPGGDLVLRVGVDPAVAEGRTTREARLHVPVGYLPERPYPVLIVYHGHGSSAEAMEASTGFSALSDRYGFLAVYPQGLPDPDGGASMWARTGPIDAGVEELPFTRALLDEVHSAFCTDPRRVYATGVSAGGGMVNYLACGLADRIAAIAPVVGNMYTPKDGGCRPSRPVAVMDVHAVDDPMPYGGDSTNPAWVLPPVPSWLAGWARLDRCDPTSQVLTKTETLHVEQWTGCGGGAEVLAYRVTGGHAWPAYLNGRPTGEAIWQFLDRFAI